MNDRRLINTEELKEICNEILIFFVDYCEKHNLRYYLCGGTALGAVRHEGFIPWDDDIDVMMDREDYERLIKMFDNSASHYKLLCHEVDENYYYPFAKICDSRTKIEEEHFENGDNLGIYIDIFPIDGDGNDFEKAKKHLQKCIDTQRVLNHAIAKHFFKSKAGIIKESIRFVRYKCIRIIGKKYYYKKLDRLLKKYPYKDSIYVANNAWNAYGVRELLPREVYEHETTVPFEGNMYRLPEDYDRYLTALYGNYMELPPEEKRVSHHDMVVYWK